MKRLLLSVVGLTVLGLLAFASPSGSRAVSAAIDCTVTHRLSVEIRDVNGELVSTGGSVVTITNDPQDGLGSRTYVDQGINDNSAVVGRVQESRACALTEGSVYTVELDTSCNVIDSDLVTTPLATDTTIAFRVHDCATPTSTPTTTATAIPTATATPTSVATATVVPATQTPVIIFVPVAPVGPTLAIPTQVAQAPFATATPVVVRVSPPNTGDAGLASSRVCRVSFRRHTFGSGRVNVRCG